MNSSVGVYRATDEQDIRVRKYGEAVYNTLSSVASVLEYPKGNIFFSRIPDYTSDFDLKCFFFQT